VLGALAEARQVLAQLDGDQDGVPGRQRCALAVIDASLLVPGLAARTRAATAVGVGEGEQRGARLLPASGLRLRRCGSCCPCCRHLIARILGLTGRGARGKSGFWLARRFRWVVRARDGVLWAETSFAATLENLWSARSTGLRGGPDAGPDDSGNLLDARWTAGARVVHLSESPPGVAHVPGRI
jgi:hypothetical protein